MRELIGNGLRVVTAILKAPVAWLTPSDVAGATGLDMEATSEALTTLDLDGWLDVWEPDDSGPAVTLSTLAASTLHARLVEVGPDETPRWALAGESDPPRRKAVRVLRSERAASLESLVDPTDPPDVLVERREELARRLPKVPFEGKPRPTLLVGTGLVPWPGPGDGRKASCPACRSKPLQPTMYCLYCDRWGLDPSIREAARPRILDRRDPSLDIARREVERLARKEKRKTRRASVAEAQRQARKKTRPA
jgi:hypothetical protein